MLRDMAGQVGDMEVGQEEVRGLLRWVGVLVLVLMEGGGRSCPRRCRRHQAESAAVQRVRGKLIGLVCFSGLRSANL
jgi:hypothetical protein